MSGSGLEEIQWGNKFKLHDYINESQRGSQKLRYYVGKDPRFDDSISRIGNYNVITTDYQTTLLKN